MRKRWIRIPMFIALAIVFLALFGYVVMSLWNWLMPAVFGWHHINYWQAVGILILSKILFGGFRGGHGPSGWRWRRRMMERWAQMSPEEREKFRHEMRSHCGPFGSMSGSKPDVGTPS